MLYRKQSCARWKSTYSSHPETKWQSHHQSQNEPVSLKFKLSKSFYHKIHYNLDQVGYSSPLSLSLTSSDGFSASLRSTTELKNIQPLIVGNPIPSGTFDQQQSVIYPSNSSQPSLQRQQSIHDDLSMNSGPSTGSSQPIQRQK
jgi:hypothetical protein